MSKRGLEITEAAATDILEQANWYAEQANEQLAVKWERAITATILSIVDYPQAAPISNFKSPDLVEIRRISVQNFPRHLIFYRVTESAVLILRVLHGARNIESLFST